MPKKGTVRINKKQFRGKVGQAFAVDKTGNGDMVFFPALSTVIEEVGSDRLDLTIDIWFIEQEDLDTVAEWEE